MPKALLKVQSRAELYIDHDGVLGIVHKAMTLENSAYKQALKYGRYAGHLDKYICIFDDIPGGIAFPRGWFQNALHLLRMNKVECVIDDCRRIMDPIDLDFRGELRDYQEQAIKAVLAREFGVLEAATGSGKTIMALAAITARKQPTIILVHNKELFHQWAERIRSFLGIEPGLIGDGRFDIQPVTVALVHTARKHLDELPKHFGHLVVDECHRVPSSMFTEAVQAFDCRYMLGLSATAYRRDGLTKLINITLGDRVHRVDPDLLRENGAVLAPEVIRRETVFTYYYRDDYPKMLSALTQDPSRNRQIAHDVAGQCSERPGVALVVSDRVQHCQALADLIQDSGLKIRVLTGKCSKGEREQIVADVQAGDVDVLCSTVQLLGEGFDCSGLSSLFLATPIRFKGRLLQVVGRILRPADGKRPVVYDYVDQEQPVLRAQAQARERALEEVAG